MTLVQIIFILAVDIIDLVVMRFAVLNNCTQIVTAGYIIATYIILHISEYIAVI